MPNPISASCKIGFSLREGGRVTLSVFDPRGRLVRDLVSGTTSKGTHTVSWDLKDLDQKTVASGVYFYRLKSDAGESIGKIAVLR